MDKLAYYTDKIRAVINGNISIRDAQKQMDINVFQSSCLQNLRNEDDKEIEEFLLLCIECGNFTTMNFATEMIKQSKSICWKEHPKVIHKIFQDILKYGQLPKSHREFYSDDPFEKFMRAMCSMLNLNKLIKNYTEQLYNLTQCALTIKNNRLRKTVTRTKEFIPWNLNSDWGIQIIQRIYELVQDNPTLVEYELKNCAEETLSSIYNNCSQNSRVATIYAPYIGELVIFCSQQEYNLNGKKTLACEILQSTLTKYIYEHASKIEVVQPVLQACKEFTKCSTLQEYSKRAIAMIPGNLLVELDESFALEKIDDFINGEDNHFISRMEQVYSKAPHIFNTSLLDDIAKHMEDIPSWEASTALTFFTAVAKQQPQKITQETLQYIMNEMDQEDHASLVLMTIMPLSEKRPDILIPYEDKIIETMSKHDMMAAFTCSMLVHMARNSEERTEKYLQVIYQATREDDSKYNISLFYNMQQMGKPFPKLLAVYEKFFKGYIANPILGQHAEQILNTIHSISLAGISKEVDEQREDIDNLDRRVTDTEENVSNIGKELDQTNVNVKGLQQDVDEHEKRLTEVEEVVEQTVEKVEEIDKKTLSHAPLWSKDVAKLLNTESEHDWRLLSRRLGYENDDIRNWATQPDPCLSLMDEWFATHKTREATFAIQKALQEMNRTDAAMIVENALKQVEDVVEDEEFEYQTPPPVFISYQWGVQQEVKLLKKHLEMCGFDSWMDIGQMGGGDKLFEKIDKGIRSAKVIICCVSEKYAASPNCNREVNLSVTLGKPIIPLLMEKMSWPPPGSMGPIFGEYLFIRFFARPNETANDDRYWPLAKFQELSMQLRYHVAPDYKVVTDELYKEWWSPPEEVIVIPKRVKSDNKKENDNIIDNNNKAEKSPEIFISYQWEKQPQIKALFKNLTEQGYTCWLDILQMGGGDTLYDKIDKGVRGCDVVLSCITSKYSLSANCRREVSLADALKKPIIPLLLEKMTWPPEGPMSMVFTPLVYINFCKPDDIQNRWDCPQMDELLLKVSHEMAPIKQIENNIQPDSGTKINNSAPVTYTSEKIAMNGNGNQAPVKKQSTTCTEVDELSLKISHELPLEISPDSQIQSNLHPQPETESNNSPPVRKTSEKIAMNEAPVKKQSSTHPPMDTFPLEISHEVAPNSQIESKSHLEPETKTNISPPVTKTSENIAMNGNGNQAHVKKQSSTCTEMNELPLKISHEVTPNSQVESNLHPEPETKTNISDPVAKSPEYVEMDGNGNQSPVKKQSSTCILL